MNFCKDCGASHYSALEAMACDRRIGRRTPGLTDEERDRLLVAACGSTPEPVEQGGTDG